MNKRKSLLILLVLLVVMSISVLLVGCSAESKIDSLLNKAGKYQSLAKEALLNGRLGAASQYQKDADECRYKAEQLKKPLPTPRNFRLEGNTLKWDYNTNKYHDVVFYVSYEDNYQNAGTYSNQVKSLECKLAHIDSVQDVYVCAKMPSIYYNDSEYAVIQDVKPLEGIKVTIICPNETVTRYTFADNKIKYDYELGYKNDSGEYYMGIFEDEEYTVPFDLDTEINDELTLYARWSKDLPGVNCSGAYIVGNELKSIYDLTEYVVPNSVDSIAFGAFKGCNTLKSLTIENKNALLHHRSLEDCTRLESLSIHVENCKEVDDLPELFGVKEFDGSCSPKTNYYMPISLKSITLTGQNIPEKFMQSVTKVTDLRLVDAVNIGNSAFHGCDELNNVILPNTLRKIGDFAFAYTKINDFTIPEGTKTIGEKAFMGSHMQKITFPSTLNTVGNLAFDYTKDLTKVNLTSVEGYAKIDFASTLSNPFSNENNDNIIKLYVKNVPTSKLVVPGSVKRIGKGAFSGMQIDSLVLENGVETISQDAFNVCLIKNIYIPSSVKSIASYAFNSDVEHVNIYCQPTSRPSGWASDWCANSFINTIYVSWGNNSL